MAARDLRLSERHAQPPAYPYGSGIFNQELIKEAIYYEGASSGQVFLFIMGLRPCPSDGEIRRMCPDVDVGTAHGQMDPKQLEKTLWISLMDI
ncbi:hypothetical protein D5R40_32390 [Okeania hirsuta]|uniref:Uncharacterized protein n=1 Tax=Okeania hirsuta TaxID=1458930 RepID=A0A3N6PU99_9CYAN|nr:hypothetical protein D5R40_32390 [Okeania hirsuta]